LFLKIKLIGFSFAGLFSQAQLLWKEKEPHDFYASFLLRGSRCKALICLYSNRLQAFSYAFHSHL